MTDKERAFVSFKEDVDIVARYQQLADEEGTSAAALYRRALRRYLLSLPTTSADEGSSQPQQSAA